ncbi:acyl-CoA thioesterase [Campylobacter suis]|uniref:Thioesterase n=1 Tax=Campylobacter suis TaxID=2790657 RepID=A0ABM8Q720_9BACT|nr:thioesterase family protein [Campylobacter suis]CAD7288687.1 hypothetical protein LMG8286_01455 [Campylobacter suis]
MKEFLYKFKVPSEAIDMHGHMNNAYYFKIMQDVGFAHSNSVGDTLEAQKQRGGVWLIRENQATYIKPVFLDDEIVIKSWSERDKKATSTRFFEFYRGEILLATAKTTFFYFDTRKNRPVAIPDEVAALYE